MSRDCSPQSRVSPQLQVDPKLIAQSVNEAIQDEIDSEPASRISQRTARTLETHRGSASDDAKRPNFRELYDELFRQAVGDEGIVAVNAIFLYRCYEYRCSIARCNGLSCNRCFK